MTNGCIRRLASVAWMLAVVTTARPAAAMPPAFLPSSPDTVLEQIPAGSQRRSQPLDRATALRSAAQNLELGRKSGDPRYDGRAEAALAAWNGVPAVPTEVYLLRATLAQRRHDFAAALRDLDLLLKREPGHKQAWLMRAGILQVQGEYAASRKACLQLGPGVDSLVVSACRTAASGINGTERDATLALEHALQASPGASTGVRAWALGILAERRQLEGDVAQAENSLHRALEIAPGDPFLLTALADLMLQQGRANEVIQMIPAENAALDLSLRRAHALTLRGLGSEERHRLNEQFATIRARGERPHLRSEAYHLLYIERDVNAALGLARANFANQREPIDRRLLLDAARAAGQEQAATPVHLWLAANGFQ